MRKVVHDVDKVLQENDKQGAHGARSPGDIESLGDEDIPVRQLSVFCSQRMPLNLNSIVGALLETRYSETFRHE